MNQIKSDTNWRNSFAIFSLMEQLCMQIHQIKFRFYIRKWLASFITF